MSFNKHIRFLNMSSYKDNRHSRAVKVSLNKIFGERCSVFKELAKLITDFSHTSRLTGGSFMVSKNLKFFVVQKLLSNHWCLGWFCDSKMALVGRTIKYVPNFMCRGKIVRKRINFPFTTFPCVSIRKQNFYLQCEKVAPINSTIRLFSEIIGELF